MLERENQGFNVARLVREAVAPPVLGQPRNGCCGLYAALPACMCACSRRGWPFCAVLRLLPHHAASALHGANPRGGGEALVLLPLL